MDDEPSPLDYNATLKRMEEGLAPMDPGIALASIAVSLKDISASLASIRNELIQMNYESQRVGNNIYGAISALNIRST